MYCTGTDIHDIYAECQLSSILEKKKKEILSLLNLEIALSSRINGPNSSLRRMPPIPVSINGDLYRAMWPSFSSMVYYSIYLLTLSSKNMHWYILAVEVLFLII